jgi:hypothetical protein
MEGGLIRGCATIWNADVHATRSTALHRCMIRSISSALDFGGRCCALQEHKRVVSEKASQKHKKSAIRMFERVTRRFRTTLLTPPTPQHPQTACAQRRGTGPQEVESRRAHSRAPPQHRQERTPYRLHGANRRRHPTQRRAAPWSLTRVNTPTAAPLTASDRRELLPDSSPLHLLLRPASPPPIRQAR